MRFCLRIITGKQAGREIPCLGSRFLIGCADNCDLKIDESQVSPYHCALLIQEDDIWLRDYGCGTVVGGRRIVGPGPRNPRAGQQRGWGGVGGEVV